MRRDPRQLAAARVIRAVRADHEPFRIEPRGAQLEPCPGHHIASEQTEYDGPVGLQGIKERGNTGHQTGTVAMLGKIALEMGKVLREHTRDAVRIVGRGMTRRLEQFGDDLGIGLAVETDSRPRGEIDAVISERSVNRAPAGAVAQEECPVDVEEDELPLHAGVEPVVLSAAHCRQSVTPRRLQMTQMKVAQRVQGYPSEARSSRPQARHSIASVAGGLDGGGFMTG